MPKIRSVAIKPCYLRRLVAASLLVTSIDTICKELSKMSIFIRDHKLFINLSFPLPYIYKGAGIALFKMINNKLHILLGLRTNRPGKGKWSIVGGKVEAGEKFLSAALREWREEIKIRLFKKFSKIQGVYKIRLPFFQWNTYIIQTTQRIKLPTNPLIVRMLSGGEFSKLEWVSLDNLKNYKLFAWVKSAIKQYLRINQYLRK